jgi:hypothetical protein
MDKRTVTIIVFFAVLAVLLILGATVFVVRDVEVSFASDDEKNVIDSQLITQSSGIESGKNIFALSEAKAVKSIEQAHPAIKVINIERKFPSTVVIHVTVRIPVVAVKIEGQTNFAMLDREMFVVQILSGEELLAREAQLGYELSLTNYELKAAQVTVGQRVPENAKNENIIAQNIIAAYAKLNLVNRNFCDFISRIYITKEVGRSIYDITLRTVSGVDIKFEATGNISEKARLSYLWYQNEVREKGLNAESVKEGYIVYISAENEKDSYFAWYRYGG